MDKKILESVYLRTCILPRYCGQDDYSVVYVIVWYAYFRPSIGNSILRTCATKRERVKGRDRTVGGWAATRLCI